MSASVRAIVERHASGLESAAAAMAADNIGGESTRGHQALLKRMASAMRADAATGKLPFAYSDGGYYASAAPKMSAGAMAILAAAGLSLTGDAMTLAALNSSLDESGTSMSDRIVIKEAMASAGRITE
jgi:hypothetical protein